MTLLDMTLLPGPSFRLVVLDNPNHLQEAIYKHLLEGPGGLLGIKSSGFSERLHCNSGINRQEYTRIILSGCPIDYPTLLKKTGLQWAPVGSAR